MADILSQEEIDSLLEVVDGEDEYTIENRNYCSIEKQIILYDFKRPTALSRNSLFYMKKIHDTFSRYLQISLEQQLNKDVEIQLHSVDQLHYDEFLMGLASSKYITPLSFFKKKGLIICSLDESIVKAMVNGKIDPFNTFFSDKRTGITPIEYSLIETIFKENFIPSFKKSWKEECHPKLLETHNDIYSIFEIIKPKDMVCHIVIEVIIMANSGINYSGMINIAYPVDINWKLFEKEL